MQIIKNNNVNKNKLMCTYKVIKKNAIIFKTFINKNASNIALKIA